MVRRYIRKTTTKYTKETLEKCLSCVRKGKMLMKKASRHRTIRNKTNNFHPKTSSGQTATNAFYEYTKNGWFDSRTFEICFFKAVFVFH